MTHQQMTFYLLQCVQHHTNQDQQRCSAKELRELHTYTGNPAKAGMIATTARKNAPGKVIRSMMVSK